MAVYDVTNRSSFESLTNWMSEVSKCAWKKSGNSPVQGVLVATKCDQSEFSQVSNQEALAFAHQHGLAFFETAAVRDTHMHWTTKMHLRRSGAAWWHMRTGTERRTFKFSPFSCSLIVACIVWWL